MRFFSVCRCDTLPSIAVGRSLNFSYSSGTPPDHTCRHEMWEPVQLAAASLIPYIVIQSNPSMFSPSSNSSDPSTGALLEALLQKWARLMSTQIVLCISRFLIMSHNLEALSDNARASVTFLRVTVAPLSRSLQLHSLGVRCQHRIKLVVL